MSGYASATMGGGPGGSPGGGGGSANSGARAIQFILGELFTAGVGILAVWVGARVMRRMLDPSAEARERARERKEEVIRRLQQTGVPLAALQGMSPAEENLLFDLVFPEDITASFSDIGGMEKVKEAMREIVVYPLLYPSVYGMGPNAAGGSNSDLPGGSTSSNLFGAGNLQKPTGRSSSRGPSALLAPPKGVLLYGPPGTGKTLLASALAKESGANFLALSPSSMLSKWLGETEQLARAVFALARRVQPTVIFIDEVDGLFRERSSSEHEAHKNLKAEFMQLWDGLATDQNGTMVIVLGATNRPYDVDPAILRRMPRAFEVGLPSQSERAAVLRRILSDAEVEPNFAYDRVAAVTEGYSGSDLKELCRAAMMQPVREALRATAQAARRASAAAAATSAGPPLSSVPVEPAKLRPLELKDVLAAREDVSTTQTQSQEYLVKSMLSSGRAFLGEGPPER